MRPPLPPGWYPDPWRQAPLRWWDGRTWTGHVSATAGRPAARPQPPAAPAVAAERGPARWLRGVLVADAVAFVVQLVAIGTQFRFLIDTWRDDDDFDPTLPSWLAVAQLAGAVGLAALVLRVIWLLRAAEAGRRLGRPARREPGLAGAGWVIPVVNFWWPLQDVAALLGRDHPERPRLGWWWGLHLFGQLGVVLVAAAAFAPVAVQSAAIAAAALAYAAAVLIERELVGAVLREHEAATGRPAAVA